MNAYSKMTTSGSWHCTVYGGRGERGKHFYKSFTVKVLTCAGKSRCEHLAAE